MLKKILFFIVLFQIFGNSNIVYSDIIPLKKPIQTKEETQKKLLVDVLKPLPKPTNEIGKKTVEKEEEIKKKKKNDIILPKKKPLIAGTKKTTNIKISKYYNKKYFN